MIKKIGVVAVTIGVVSSLVFATSGMADDAKQAIGPSSWAKVSETDLASQRAGDSAVVAEQTITQSGDQTCTNCSAGNIYAGPSTFADSKFSINTLNVGNNAKIANQMIITVNIE